ncbi:flagellar protein FliT [Caballeronia sp.]|uniref:flagellar protein FliT n=1 Tax=Caballeronia sp. TaxID=1931223 RepID=UPI003C4789E7
MDQNTLIEQLLAMTLDIEHAAAMANWQEAARLTEVRSPLFAHLTKEQDAVSMKKIDRIRAIDAAVAANAKTTQVELQVEYNDAMRKAQGASKYLQGARF